MNRHFTQILMIAMLAVMLTSCVSEQTLFTETTEAAGTTEPAKTSQMQTSTVAKTETPSQDSISGVAVDHLLAHPDARLAIAKAIDKEVISDYILSNGSLATDFLVPKGLHILSSGEDFRQDSGSGLSIYNTALAKQHWQRAKEALNIDAMTLKVLTYDSDGSVKIAKYIKEQLEQTLDGLTVEINAQPFNEKSRLALDGDFDIEFTGWGAEYPDADSFIHNFSRESVQNTGVYQNSKFDDAVMVAKNNLLSSQQGERLDALRSAEHILLSDGGVIPLYQTGQAYLLSENIRGIEAHSYGANFVFSHATTSNLSADKAMIRMVDARKVLMLDTSKVVDETSQMVIGNVFEGLTRLDENDVPVLAGAESVDISDDGLTYTFKLRKNALWSNNTPVLAKDYVYAFHRLANPRTAGKNVQYLTLANIKNHVAVIAGEQTPDKLGVTAVDDYTLKIELESPMPHFLKLMTYSTYMPMNEAYTLAQKHLYGTKSENTLYNGPYVISNWEPGYGFALAKNDLYWNVSAVKNDGVMYQISSSVNEAVNLYDNGEADLVILSGNQVDAYKEDSGFYVKPLPAVYYLILNIHHK